MKNLVVITEIYNDEQPVTFEADYDKLPIRTKNKVDSALKEEDKAIEIDPYEDGWQSFDDQERNDCKILPGEQLTFIDSVVFYER